MCFYLFDVLASFISKMHEQRSLKLLDMVMRQVQADNILIILSINKLLRPISNELQNIPRHEFKLLLRKSQFLLIVLRHIYIDYFKIKHGGVRSISIVDLIKSKQIIVYIIFFDHSLFTYCFILSIILHRRCICWSLLRGALVYNTWILFQSLSGIYLVFYVGKLLLYDRLLIFQLSIFNAFVNSTVGYVIIIVEVRGLDVLELIFWAVWNCHLKLGRVSEAWLAYEWWLSTLKLFQTTVESWWNIIRVNLLHLDQVGICVHRFSIKGWKSLLLTFFTFLLQKSRLRAIIHLALNIHIDWRDLLLLQSNRKIYIHLIVLQHVDILLIWPLRLTYQHIDVWILKSQSLAFLELRSERLLQRIEINIVLLLLLFTYLCLHQGMSWSYFQLRLISWSHGCL